MMKGINYGRFISEYQSQDVGYVLQQLLVSAKVGAHARQVDCQTR